VCSSDLKLIKIAEVCKVDIVWLLTGKGDMFLKKDDENETNKEILKHPSIANDQIEMINKFEDHEAVMNANEYLLNMEKKSPKEFHLAVGYLKGISDSLDRKTQQSIDRRKENLPYDPPDRRKKAG
jgi:hypothetical protein